MGSRRATGASIGRVLSGKSCAWMETSRGLGRFGLTRASIRRRTRRRRSCGVVVAAALHVDAAVAVLLGRVVILAVRGGEGEEGVGEPRRDGLQILGQVVGIYGLGREGAVGDQDEESIPVVVKGGALEGGVYLFGVVVGASGYGELPAHEGAYGGLLCGDGVRYGTTPKDALSRRRRGRAGRGPFWRRHRGWPGRRWPSFRGAPRTPRRTA